MRIDVGMISSNNERLLSSIATRALTAKTAEIRAARQATNTNYTVPNKVSGVQASL
jgi:hypothetical protein